MKKGDLVQCTWGEIGIVLWQIGTADRYMVYWGSGNKYAYNGCNLFYIGE